jgi:hypothetical protein
VPEVDEGVCYGDSGGPLYRELPITGMTLVGITSAGVGCALQGYPDLFTRAGDFVDALRARGANPFGLSAPIPGLHTPAPIGPFSVKGMGADMQFASAGLTSTTMAGDFNHDGYTDIAYWGTCGADLHDCWRVHINAKNGSLKSPPDDYGASIRFHDSTPKSTPMTGDFNHDGYADIAYYGICGNPGAACWRIHVNNKAGGFNSAKDYGGEIQFEGNGITNTPMVGDFNNDGYADIAYWGTCGADLHACWRVHVNAKNGSFVSPPSDYGANTRFMGDVVAGTPMAGDFNGDGYTDITYWGKCGADGHDCWRVHVNGKNGKFSSAPDYGASMWFATSDPTSTPRSGDFNGDGYSDIAYYGKCGSPPTACWRVHLSNHAGAFEVHGYGPDMWFAGTDPIHAPMAGDFDGDGVDGIAYKGKCGSGGACWRVHQR